MADLNVTVSSGALAVSLSGADALAPLVADAKSSADSAAADAASIADVRTTLWQTMHTTPVVADNMRVKPDGTTETATNYREALVALPASTLGIVVTSLPVGTGFYLATWYSDAAGTAFLSHSTEVGGEQYTTYALMKPAGAQAVRINGSVSQTIVVDLKSLLQQAGDRVVALEQNTAHSVDVAASLRDWTPESVTLTSNMRVKPDGTTEEATGYEYGTAVLAGTEYGIRVTATVTGTGFHLATYYSDVAGTIFLGNSVEVGGDFPGIAYTDYPLMPPTGTRCVRINSGNGVTILVGGGDIADNIALRVDTLETTTAPLPNMIAAVSAWEDQAITIVNNAYVNADGSVSTGITGNYQYAQVALTGDEQAVRIAAFVVGSGRRLITYYSDADCTQFLSNELPGNAQYIAPDYYTANVPATARGMLINTQSSQATIVQYKLINTALAQNASGTSSTWAGKKFTSEGDSTVEQGQWQGYPVSALGFGAFVNTGVAGTRVSYLTSHVDDAQCMCDDARVSLIPSDTDCLTVLAGINDHGQSIPLGAITAKSVRSGFDATTFYGALEQMALKQKTRLQTARILWMGQTYVDRGSGAPVGWENSLTNLQGLTQWDYADAMREVANKWGIPFLSMIDECGWDTTNIASFITTEPGKTDEFIHPDGRGGKRMGGIVSYRLLQLQPVP